MSLTPTDTDIVSLAALHLAATIGPDNWHRIRPQPIHLTLHLHLSPSYLNTPGQSDNVTDSLHYGHLAKALDKRVSTRSRESGYPSAKALVKDVTDAAFEFVVSVSATGRDRDREEEAVVVLGGVIHAVRVVLELPKQILLARGFEIEITTRTSDWSPPPRSSAGSTTGAIIRVTNLILPVLIGLNPPERLAKQLVITHLTFFEATAASHTTTATTTTSNSPEEIEIDYPSIVQRIATDIEHSAHLTLEKLVYDILHTAYRACDARPSPNSHSHADASSISAITVRCEKPSALSFADASGVEMTRTWEALRRDSRGGGP